MARTITSFMIDTKTLDAVDKEADRRGTNRSRLLREIVDHYLQCRGEEVSATTDARATSELK